MDERARVVVGADDSPGSRAALAFALRDAARRDAAVEVVSAFEPPPEPGTEYWAPVYGSSAVSLDLVRDEVRRDVERVVQEVTGELRTEIQVPPVTIRVVPGGAADALLHAAEGADLLVVGSRGRGGFRSMVLGSVSIACALHSPCPVTIVHQPKRSAAGEEPVAAGVPAVAEGHDRPEHVGRGSASGERPGARGRM